MPVVLVTGGAGFIGSHVVDALVASDRPTRVLDSFREDVHPARASGDADSGSSGRLEVVRGDIRDPETLDAVLEDVDVVCHQAAKVGLGVDFSDAPDYVETNEAGTAMLLSAMTRVGVCRLVLASSMVVYGEGRYRDGRRLVGCPPRSIADLEAGRFDPVSRRTGLPLRPVLLTEDAPLDPRNVYAATKVGQEHLVRAWARSVRGRAAVLRYHNVYGPRMPMGTPYAGVASLFRSALERGERPRVFEDGHQRRDFVHVTDVARANLAALAWTDAKPAGTVRAFNVGSGAVHTVGEFATTLSDALGGPAPIVTGEYRLGDVRHITASSDRLRTELGWRPEVDFANGVREFARAPLRAPAVGVR